MLAIGFLEEISLFKFMTYKSTAEVNLENLFKDSQSNKPIGFYLELKRLDFHPLYLISTFIDYENPYIICDYPENKKILNSAETVNILCHLRRQKPIHFLKKRELEITYNTINIIPVYKNTNNTINSTTVINSIFN